MRWSLVQIVPVAHGRAFDSSFCLGLPTTSLLVSGRGCVLAGSNRIQIDAPFSQGAGACMCLRIHGTVYGRADSPPPHTKLGSTNWHRLSISRNRLPPCLVKIGSGLSPTKSLSDLLNNQPFNWQKDRMVLLQLVDLCFYVFREFVGRPLARDGLDEPSPPDD